MKILIIKLGASGDVIRTTPMLRIFPNEDITWVTQAVNKNLLPLNDSSLTKVLAIEESYCLKKESYDLIVSLDDVYEVAELVSSIQTKDLVGIYLNQKEELDYTESAASWFDMGLISKFGKAKADEIKMANTRSYQDILFEMLGFTFKGEEYFIQKPTDISPQNKLVAIEARAGDRWPMKRWHRYPELADNLSEKGYSVKFLEQRPTIQDYIADIATCETLVTGDTLAMHIGLALKKQVVTIFTCTSPTEIYGYGRMKKIISPHLNEAFYRTDYIPKVVEAISLDEVYKAVIDE